jgi:stage II sporulation protein D
LGVTGPPIRIGLTETARDVRISAPGEFYLLERVPEATRRPVSGEINVRVERGEASATFYRIQVASLSGRDPAESLRARLSDAFTVPGLVRENPATATFQVRIGEFKTREEALEFAAAELIPAGYRDCIVVRDTGISGSGERRIALRGSDLFVVSSAGFLVSPSSAASLLRLDGKAYRGILEVTINHDGFLTVVNQLGVEEYLLGVVPAEINPSRYPEYAALAAQSVAARTYALRNMGRFRADGFDLTADVRTQVYGGASLETEPTNEAVRTTAGLAIYYKGALIDAMYTSTCGGRTEDFAKVFGGPDVPYLKSVPCAVEDEAGDENGPALTGKHYIQAEIYTADGRLAGRNLELAHVLGISGPEAISPVEAVASPSPAEAERWIARAAGIAGNGGQSVRTRRQDMVSRAGFISSAAESLFGRQEIERRISAGDIKYYLGTLSDEGDIPAEARSAYAFLMQAGLWSPSANNMARPREPVTRADGVSLLVRWVEYRRPEVLRGGVFAGFTGSPTPGTGLSEISVRWGTKTQQLRLSQDLHLFRITDGRSTPIEQVRLIGGEKLRFHLNSDGRVDFLEVELNPTGTASDRFSPVASWKTTVTAADLAEKLRPFAGSIGPVLDVRPSETGQSGRAVRVELIGSRGTNTMNGYRFRGALGLRDTLFTITRAVSPDGKIESFTFQGRGWGHGVGLCQVGAYGMARAGRTWEEILGTYYQGVEIRKAY